MAGRPRKPSALRELEGNRSRTDIPPDLPLDGVPSPTQQLADDGLAFFMRVAGELSAIGVAKSFDSDALTLLSDLWAHYWKASRDGDTKAMCAIAARWASLAGKYGLTPADRAKLMATPKQKSDPVEDYFFTVTG